MKKIEIIEKVYKGRKTYSFYWKTKLLWGLLQWKTPIKVALYANYVETTSKDSGFSVYSAFLSHQEKEIEFEVDLEIAKRIREWLEMDERNRIGISERNKEIIWMHYYKSSVPQSSFFNYFGNRVFYLAKDQLPGWKKFIKEEEEVIFTYSL